MYIFADKNGQIKEIVNDIALRQANDNINHIYLYCEELPVENISLGLIRYKLPNGTLTPEIQFSLTKITKMIPYDKKRDLKYFKDYTEYEFYDIVIPDGSDPLIPNVLGETGLIEFTARFTDSLSETIYALQTATFYVEDSIVKKTEFITGDQYNYLIKLIGNVTSGGVIANPTGTPTNKLYTIAINDVIYKVSIDNYLKTITFESDTIKKTYTITDDQNNETQIIEPINWLVDAILSSGSYVTINKSDGNAIQFQVPGDDYIVNAQIVSGTLKLTKKSGTVVEFAGGGSGSITDYCDGATYDSTTHILTLTFADSRSPTVVPIPYLTSQLTNDSGFIGNSALASYYLKTEIDALPVSHFSNDSGYITASVANLVNYTKTSDLGAAALSNSYTDLDDLPIIVDNLTTNDATKILSAKQGYEINNRLKAVEGLGRFLSVWNANEGYPDDLPPADQLPYELHNGDYYIVGNIASGGAINYKPHVTIIDGKGYFIDAVSTDVESEELHTKDIYIYDGANKIFKLISDSSADVYWNNIKGNNPMVNTYLAALFNAKQDTLSNGDDIEIDDDGHVNFTNDSGYITHVDLDVETDSHLTYNNTTGVFGIATDYVIPSIIQIAKIQENAEAIAELEEALNDLQPKNDNTLSTTDKTVVGAINEIDAAVKALDFTGYQTKKDNSITVPTGETDKTVVGALNWLNNNKLNKEAAIGSLQAGDTVYGADSVGNPKRINAGDLGNSYVGKIVCSHVLNTVELVIASEGGIYWDKISDFDDYGMYEWERTDVRPSYEVSLTSGTLELNETIDATWGIEYTNTLVVATAGLSLPDTIVIKVGETTLTASDYSYDSDTGEFTINANKVKGNIEIIAEAE